MNKNSSAMKLIKTNAIWLVFIVEVIFFAIFSKGTFISGSNMVNIMRQVSYYGIASVGMTFVILIAGIDLSIGSIITLVNMVCAFMMVNMNCHWLVAVLAVLVIGVVIGVFALTFSFAGAWGEHDKQVEERASADVFMTIEAQDFDGQPFTIDDASKTKLTAYNVWETTCPPCIAEMDDLEELTKLYDTSEFRLVGVCADLNDKNGQLDPAQMEKAKQILSDAGVTYTNLIPDQRLLDFFSSNIPGFPTTFFVDSEGRIIATRAGANDLDGWKAQVDGLLPTIN